MRKRKDILSIEGNNAAANDVQKLKALEKRPVDAGILLLANGDFEKEKGGYESEESEDDDEVLLDVVEDSAAENSRKKNRKRKAAKRLEGNKYVVLLCLINLNLPHIFMLTGPLA